MRSYDNRGRAEAAARTSDRILDAIEALIVRVGLAELTLARVAEAAGVTVQTVLRHHGSREGCVQATSARVRARIDQQRGHTRPGDVDGAVQALVAHYEAEGRLVLALLAQEASDPTARDAVAEGRAYHRAWVQRCLLPPDDDAIVDALVGVTDLSLWRLYRLDLHRTAEQTEAIMLRCVRSILERP